MHFFSTAVAVNEPVGCGVWLLSEKVYSIYPNPWIMNDSYWRNLTGMFTPLSDITPLLNVAVGLNFWLQYMAGQPPCTWYPNGLCTEQSALRASRCPGWSKKVLCGPTLKVGNFANGALNKTWCPLSTHPKHKPTKDQDSGRPWHTMAPLLNTPEKWLKPFSSIGKWFPTFFFDLARFWKQGFPKTCVFLV